MLQHGTLGSGSVYIDGLSFFEQRLILLVLIFEDLSRLLCKLVKLFITRVLSFDRLGCRLLS